MVTISPHTTRATGTVLTAAIYNADHQNHVTNATTINTDAAYKNVANTFTSDQTIPNLILSSATVRRSVSNSNLTLSGGNSSTDGADILLYGSTHATLANDARFDADELIFRKADGTSGTSLTVDGDLTVSGTLTGAAAAFPSGTIMVFRQTAAPTGWTKLTTNNDKALRVVSGSLADGGTVAFTTALASQSVTGTIGNTTSTGSNSGTTSTGTVGGTAITTANLPAHSHGASGLTFTGDALGAHGHGLSTGGSIHGTGGAAEFAGGSGVTHQNATIASASAGTPSGTIGGSTANTGSGTTHTHSLTMNSHTHTITMNAHNHTFTGNAINLDVQHVDVIFASKD